jgi:Fe-S cluster biosynthesis and repair protein YggX
VWLPAIEGLVPTDVVRTFRAFLEFCYLVRKDNLSETDLDAADDALRRFHQYREVFRRLKVRPLGFSLPRQHSMVHYRSSIEELGAPNGLCSSITESKHITAVKQPWRRSNKNEPMQQMLVNIERLEKLDAARRRFAEQGLLRTAFFTEALEAAGLVDVAVPDTESAVATAETTPDAGEHDDGGVVEGDQIDAEVTLARTAGMPMSQLCSMHAYILIIHQFEAFLPPTSRHFLLAFTLQPSPNSSKLFLLIKLLDLQQPAFRERLFMSTTPH